MVSTAVPAARILFAIDMEIAYLAGDQPGEAAGNWRTGKSTPGTPTSTSLIVLRRQHMRMVVAQRHRRLTCAPLLSSPEKTA